ncbi:DUF2726 domain-containing protein [Vibrio fluvialis]|uniref:DUF2726 domain-containing protein n=1 Tax=Vibrio TaxID=662 RepID=UPI001C9CCA7E|nr:DUF2726 domain-containing protein [Vibrio fluvialis]EGQ9845401.1 DUF2726 domain-containing protein [Vibrio cholerae]EGR1041567.1 DUF2726 domain-containing protein [Vibrio cholerae]EKO3944093.1 DUF2726 domain-containing protein [Vibrio fluvialis]MBY8124281.1 DUF2726 domain-containing protein [Vibrio fluvialis]MCG6381985.1 DUF2726 domain-containing protein [Vibrio fluvialis]
MFEIVVIVVFGYIVWKLKKTNTNESKSWEHPNSAISKYETKVPTPPTSSCARIEHIKQSYLATENERKLYFALQKALPSEYVIHSQVSLMALVKPVNFKHNSKTWAKRMDFVITDKATKILAVIELDDSTHQWKKRRERDQYVNSVLDGHHTLVRFPTKRFYEPSEVAEVLSRETEIRCNKFGTNFVKTEA